MFFTWAFGAAVLGLVVFGAYVRLAPSDPARWHRMPGEVVTKTLDGRAMRVVEAGPEGLARIDAIARRAPRVTVLAGSVEEGMVTYVARSAFWGFPDYITARQVGERLELYSRLRFGRGDFGVNGARLDTWLAEM